MKHSTRARTLFRAASILLSIVVSPDVVFGTEPGEATEATKAANRGVRQRLPFDTDEDQQDARRGLIDPGPETVRDAHGHVVWDLKQYAFLTDDSPAPETVNPSLWRQARLNLVHGLFRVTDRIYQVRGYDLSNVSSVVGDTG